jgi:hypothetical protein
MLKPHFPAKLTGSHPKNCFDGENERFYSSGKEVEAAIVETIAMQTDTDQTAKDTFAAQMRFWDGFYIQKVFLFSLYPN